MGVTGLESSHVDALIGLLNVAPGVPGARVVALCGTNDERRRELAAYGDIDRLVSEPAELETLVDAVIVCDRRGSTHRGIAEPLLARGLAVLVDKPFAASAGDARAIVATARRAGALVTSYSSLRFSPEVQALASATRGLHEPYTVEVHGPADPDSPYDGIYFYLSHHADVALRLAAGPIRDVRIARSGSEWTVRASVAANEIVLRFSPNPDPRSFAVGIPCLGPMRTITNAALETGFQAFLTAVSSRRPPIAMDDLIRPIELIDMVAAELKTR